MLMSKSEYARHRGVSRQTVYDWVAKGEVVLSGNKIDVEATERNMQNEQKKHEYTPQTGNDVRAILGGS
jgi:transposase